MCSSTDNLPRRMRRAAIAVAAMMMLLAAACADGPIRSQTPAARGTTTALNVAAPKRFPLQMPLMRVARAEASATLLDMGPNAGKILIVGGSGRVVDLGTKEIEPLLASTELYDPRTNTFAAGPNMHVAREAHSATMIVAGPSAGKILIAGGEGDDGFLASTELYDPLSNRFIAGPKMSTVGIDHTATAIASGPNAGKILIAGGDGYSSPLDSTELSAPAAHFFAAGPSMTGDRWAQTATLLESGPNAGKILIAGGDGYSFTSHGNSGILASTELYDPASNTFAPGPFMNVARESATATAIASGPDAGEILIAGGFGESRKPLSSTEIYDPKTNRFTPGPTMSVAREEHTATTIAVGPNAGKILIAGGLGTDEPYLASTELYDPVSNTFMAGPNMRVARYEDTATAIASGPDAGTIVIAGGANYVGVLASAELYDPATNKFAPPPKTPEMKLELLPAAAF